MLFALCGINVYCDTLTKGHNWYTTWPADGFCETEAAQALIDSLKLPDFVRKAEVEETPLNDHESEGEIGLYVTFQIRRIGSKHKLLEHEERQLATFISELQKSIAALPKPVRAD